MVSGLESDSLFVKYELHVLLVSFIICVVVFFLSPSGQERLPVVNCEGGLLSVTVDLRKLQVDMIGFLDSETAQYQTQWTDELFLK